VVLEVELEWIITLRFGLEEQVRQDKVSLVETQVTLLPIKIEILEEEEELVALEFKETGEQATQFGLLEQESDLMVE
jgi:hypothetical protein